GSAGWRGPRSTRGASRPARCANRCPTGVNSLPAMRIDDVTLTGTDGPMRLYAAHPDGEARAGVVVIQEAFGVNDHIEDVTRRFADAGYLAVAPDLFHRAGGGTAPYDDFSKVLPLFEGLDGDDAVLRDVDLALDYLHDQGIDDAHIGVVGFCLGGRVSF